MCIDRPFRQLTALAITVTAGSVQKAGALALPGPEVAEQVAANGAGATHAAGAAEPPASPDSGSASDLQQLLLEADDAAG